MNASLLDAPLSSSRLDLDLLGAGFGQHARLLTLAGAPGALAVERIAEHEAVNDLYRFDVDALSASTDLDLAAFIGEELTVGLLQPDGGRRAWHGLCTSAAWLGADGGAARYRLRLEPALSLLALRRDSWIFQDRTARDIVTELLRDYYPQVRFDFDLAGDGARRHVCTQYRESDLAFFARLLASEGWSWRFEDDQAGDAQVGDAQVGAASADGHGQGHHRLAALPLRARDGNRRQHRRLRCGRRAGANGVAVASWDPAQLLAPAAELASTLEAGALPALQVYEGSGERRFAARDEAERQGRTMLHTLELDNKVLEGAGAVRHLAAGHVFGLTQHARYPDGENAFAVLWVRHDARNNLHAGQGARADDAIYRNTFGCVRDTVAIVPRAAAVMRAPTAQGPQTALVVGLPDAATTAASTTTRDHQVRIQFPWQRGAAPNPGGMAHQADTEGNAPGDDRSGSGCTWPRRWPAWTGARSSRHASAPLCWSTSSKAKSTAP